VDERRTSPVELLWDLVFVFAITQTTTLLAHDLTWKGFGQGMLVLALVWWAWSAYVWAANAEQEDSRALRGVLLVGMVFVFVAGLALPHAWGDRATLFACAYAGVRLLHLGLYAHAARRGQASWSPIIGFGITIVIGMGLLVAGSFLDEGPRAVLWTLAVAIDYAGPAWLTREKLRGLQEVAVAHFAERYSLFVIICLGESIVATGLSAHERPLDANLVLAVALGLMATIGMWWTYFDRFAATAEERRRLQLPAPRHRRRDHRLRRRHEGGDPRPRRAAHGRRAAGAVRRRRAVPRRQRGVPAAARGRGGRREARRRRRAAGGVRARRRPLGAVGRGGDDAGARGAVRAGGTARPGARRGLTGFAPSPGTAGRADAGSAEPAQRPQLGQRRAL